MKEHIRTWQEGAFRLELYDLNERDRYGKWLLGYEFYHAGTLVFAGEDFHCSPRHGVDSDATVGGLLTFLSLRPGDTDAEYFEDYTEAQLAFADAHGEELSSYARALEEGRYAARDAQVERDDSDE